MSPLSNSSFSIEDLEAALESIGEGVIIVNRHGRIVRANHLALILLGYKESEVIGTWFFSKIGAYKVDKEKIKWTDRPMVRAIVTGRPAYDYLYYQGAKKRSRIPVFVSASPIMKNGQPIGAIQIFRDISIEESVEQMKSEFISLASHQLRTPLSSIKTYSHMLLDGYMGQIDERTRPALEIIVAATNRMNQLISTLLNITRLESGAVVVQKNLIDIVQIAKEVMEEMAIPAKNRSIKLKLYVKGQGSTRIRSDGPIIKEVLTNLVSNSVKYSNENDLVAVTVVPEQSYVTFIVKDSGLGIPSSAKRQIFSKFFRASNVIQLETNGTGLGLYLVKGLIDELGGEISFTSKEGRGTTFKVKLPRKPLPKQ